MQKATNFNYEFPSRVTFVKITRVRDSAYHIPSLAFLKRIFDKGLKQISKILFFL